MASSRLHAAAERGDTGRLKAYLNARDDVDSFDEAGCTALSLAIRARKAAAVKMLLTAGANSSLPNKDGLFPLYGAAFIGDIRIAKMLMAAGADKDAVLEEDKSGSALNTAVRRSHKEMVRYLLDIGCDVNRRSKDGIAPLVNAAVAGRNDMATMLLNAGADLNTVGDDLRITALHTAAVHNAYAVAQNLIERGADLNIADAHGGTALHNAVGNNSGEVVELLINAGADVNCANNESQTPLHFACLEGYDKFAYTLLCAGADVAAKDDREWTPLHCCAKEGHVDVIELLLAAGADRNAMDIDGYTPLRLASIAGRPNAIQLLLDAGTDPNKLDKNGQNALFGAANVHVVKALVGGGASAKCINKDGWTVLHYAAARERDAGVLCALYKAGADPLLVDPDNVTAADVARALDDENATKMLELLEEKHRSLLAAATTAIID